MKIEDAKVREWIVKVLHAKTRDVQRADMDMLAELQRQLGCVKAQKNRLLNLRLLDEIDAETFADKQCELREKELHIELQLEAHGRQQSEYADLAVKVFELSQALQEKWFTADIAEKRQMLEILCLNCTLQDVSLCLEMRKPFDLLAKGLLGTQCRGDCPNFEPSPDSTIPFVMLFLKPPEPYLLTAKHILLEMA